MRVMTGPSGVRDETSTRPAVSVEMERGPPSTRSVGSIRVIVAVAIVQMVPSANSTWSRSPDAAGQRLRASRGT